MKEYFLSEPRLIRIPALRVAKARRFGTAPEDEVTAYLNDWIQQRGADPGSVRKFGFDVPVPETDKAKGIRGYEYWVQAPDTVSSGVDVAVEDFPGGEYVSLRITDPFTDPFNSIPQGWKKLNRHIKDNDLDVDYCTPGSCLEEVLETDGVRYMDVMVRLK